MYSVTCVIHLGEVDQSDTIELPNGPVCTRCYEWMENLIDEEPDDDDGEEFFVIFIEEDDDDDD